MKSKAISFVVAIIGCWFVVVSANAMPTIKNDKSKESELVAALRPVSIWSEPKSIELDGPYAYRQLLIFGKTVDGQTVDLTRLAQLIQGSDAVAISKNRLISAVSDGSGKLVFQYKNLQHEIPFSVKNSKSDFKASFRLHVQPVLSKLGCNAGTCHGSKEGKNGFQLSLRGYDAITDYRSLTDDLAARRFNRAAPDQSLFLLKASGAVPHAGGAIVQPGNPHYEILRSWISQGAKFDSGPVVKVQSIDVLPKNPITPLPGMKQQIAVIAKYTDGTTKDVTREAFVESGNIEVAKNAGGGSLELIRRGEAAALVRYEGAYAATTVTVMGNRKGFQWKQPPTFNFVDKHVYNKLKRVKVSAAELCTDDEFIRRVYLDLTGLPPSPAAVKAFLADRRDTQTKRNALVDRLIGSPAYVENWTNKWADLLQVNRKFLGEQGAVALRNWIKQSVADNRPYDQFARQIITASGSNLESPAASYYKTLRKPEDLMENTTHLFLAIRFNCNKCHDHPFERWTQDQYYNLTAYFAQVARKRDPNFAKQNIGGSAVEGATPLVEIIYDKSSGDVKHERTGEIAPPAFPYRHAKMPDTKLPRRRQLADWLTSEANPYFARSFVNRLWGYMFGVGIIDPIDDIRAGNPPSNPELLDALEAEFIRSGFDVQHILAIICKSRVYQHSFKTNRWNEDDDINFSHFTPRRLPAETLYDTIHASLGAPLNIPGAAKGLRAMQLPDAGIKVPFLDDFGRPVRESACECERSSGVVLGPIMKLINGPTIANALKNPKSEINQLIASEKDDRVVVDEIFLRLLARKATDAEFKAALQSVAEVGMGHDALVAQFRAYETVLAAKQAQWEKDIARVPVWTPTKPTSMKSDAGAVFNASADGTIFVTGPLKKDVYRIRLNSKLKTITGLKLDVLADKRLPAGGPGRAKNGNFVVNHIAVFAVDPKDPKKRTPIQLYKPQADFSQAGWPVRNALVRNDGNGWAVSPRFNTNHYAMFEVKGNAVNIENKVLEIVIRQQFPQGDHSLGKFRFSVTNSKRPLSTKKLSPPLAAILKIPAAKRSDGQKTVLASHFKSMDANYQRLFAAVKQSQYEIDNRRLVGFQDVAWALINSPAFLFNR